MEDKIYLMEGCAYAEDGKSWYIGQKINEDDVEVVYADLTTELADALESLVLNLDEGDFISTTRIDNAKAALKKVGR